MLILQREACIFQVNGIRRTSFLAWVAELVDARDLKSLGA